jgi:hypothetical protein
MGAASVGGKPVTFDAFLEQAWSDHGDHAEEVGPRLEQGYELIETPAQIAPFARILAHVDGEHLAHWAEGAVRLERLRTHSLWRDDSDAPAIVRRLVAAMHFGNGADSVAGLSAADRAHAHAVAAAALVAQRRTPDAIRHFRAALAAAAPGLPESDPAIRALAVTSNNLASTLEEMPSRSAGETAIMVDAARAARQYWGRAGGWVETERAEYMLAKCLLAAGDAKGALDHAEQCAAICEANNADPFERFFALSMRALAHRALGAAPQFAQARTAALDCYGTLAADERSWCESTLKQIS